MTSTTRLASLAIPLPTKAKWFALAGCALLLLAHSAAARCTFPPGYTLVPCGSTTPQDVQTAFNYGYQQLMTDDTPTVTSTQDPLACKARFSVKDDLTGTFKGIFDGYIFRLRDKHGAEFIRFCTVSPGS